MESIVCHRPQFEREPHWEEIVFGFRFILVAAVIVIGLDITAAADRGIPKFDIAEAIADYQYSDHQLGDQSKAGPCCCKTAPTPASDHQAQ
jgi:hypothetical protein